MPESAPLVQSSTFQRALPENVVHQPHRTQRDRRPQRRRVVTPKTQTERQKAPEKASGYPKDTARETESPREGEWLPQRHSQRDRKPQRRRVVTPKTQRNRRPQRRRVVTPKTQRDRRPQRRRVVTPKTQPGGSNVGKGQRIILRIRDTILWPCDTPSASDLSNCGSFLL